MTEIIYFPYVPRTSLHFDRPCAETAARRLATDPIAVARHSFYPFIRHVLVVNKIESGCGGGIKTKPPKLREIDYADHRSSHIFTHYAYILRTLYEAALVKRNLGHSVIAFRSLGKSNIHFANEGFEAGKAMGECAALASDLKNFFPGLQPHILKNAWSRLLGVDRLPADHFAVFKAVTQFSWVDRQKLYETLGLDPDNPRADGRNRICSPKEFRDLVRANGLCMTNRTGRGIPQGSPISAILANIYMLDFDQKVNSFAAECGGYYRRYCDDILAILPTPELRNQALDLIREELTRLGLEAHPDKTEEIDFAMHDGKLVASKVLNYLGFTFDGRNKRVRPASVARFYKKMRLAVGRAKVMQWKAYQRTGQWTPLRKKKLYRLYSYLGRRNFVAYVLRAAKIMQDDGIRKQIRQHWKKLQALIKGE